MTIRWTIIWHLPCKCDKITQDAQEEKLVVNVNNSNVIVSTSQIDIQRYIFCDITKLTGLRARRDLP